MRRFSENAPIPSKLDFWGLWDLATQLKILSHSKILPELGDIVVGSLKLSDFRKSPVVGYYKSFGKVVSKLSQNCLKISQNPRFGGSFQLPRALSPSSGNIF